jgi:hypothetical protein
MVRAVSRTDHVIVPEVAAPFESVAVIDTVKLLDWIEFRFVVTSAADDAMEPRTAPPDTDNPAGNPLTAIVTGSQSGSVARKSTETLSSSLLL